MLDKKNAFVLMPFKEPYNSYYDSIYKPALEDAGYKVSIVKDLYESRPVIDEIQKSILASDLILCEMSTRNANVFYELGLAHAIGKPAILVSQEGDIPFDLQHIKTFLYDEKKLGWQNELRNAITTSAS